MQVTVTTVIFGLPDGKHVQQKTLMLPAATLTVGELLVKKAHQEVAEHTTQNPADDAPATMQGARATRDTMVVIDGRRIVDPDTVVTLNPDSRIEFIKILPLVGG
ncbi:MAG: hypothetical protein ACE5HC_09305 [Candidatus Binatia bacterium]